MDGEVGEVLVDSEAMESIPADGRNRYDKVWGSTCAQAKKSQATSAHSALTDEDGIFRDVLSVKE